jgi:hypothetical protein
MSAQVFPPLVTAHARVLLLDPDSGRNQAQYSPKLNDCEDKDTPEHCLSTTFMYGHGGPFKGSFPTLPQYNG